MGLPEKRTGSWEAAIGHATGTDARPLADHIAREEYGVGISISDALLKLF